MADRGDFAIPHQAIPMGDGNLKIVMPEEIEKYFQAQKLKHSFNKSWEILKCMEKRLLKYCLLEPCHMDFFEVEQNNFMMECNIKASDCADYFGLTINTDEDIDNGYLWHSIVQRKQSLLISFQLR